MPYTFKYVRDEGNEFDKTDVEFKVDSCDCTHHELTEVFQRFLIACGYHIKGELGVIVDEDK